MIQPNELRIGNLVEEEVLGRVKIISILSNVVCVSVKHMNLDRSIGEREFSLNILNIHPIPLSPEVLKAAGFSYSKKPDWYVSQPELENIEYRVKEVPGGWRISKGFFKWDDELTLIHHLHELQNVYFAIQQGELTYNPSK